MAAIDQSLTIVGLANHPQYATRILGWLRSTWADPHDEFSTTIMPSTDRPGALLALQENAPVGVLAFKRYQTPSQDRQELWINALYVVPDCRHRRIGSKLVETGIKHCIPNFATRLFVYTDIPLLYEQQGWKRLGFAPEFGTYTMCFGEPAEAS